VDYYCILDTSAVLQRYQPDSQKDKNFIDALFENKKIVLFIPIGCVTETVQQFYNACKKGKINVAERTSLVNRLRQDIKDEVLVEYPAEKSLFAKTERVFEKSFSVGTKRAGKKGGHFITLGDILVIATAYELSSGKKKNEEFCILTYDPHLYNTANVLGIKSYDPETDSIDKMPQEFCRRGHKREKYKLKVTGKNDTKDMTFSPTETIDICEDGICVKGIIGSKGEILDLRLSTYDPKNPIEIHKDSGAIKWTDRVLKEDGTQEERTGININSLINMKKLLLSSG
jgi:hypothetical protein